MKKAFLLGILLTVLSVSMVSCDDEDYDPINAPFLGKWVQDDGRSTFVFDSDGWGSYSDFNGTYDFTWDWNDYEVDIYFQNGDEWNYGWDMDGPVNLILYDDYTGAELYYTRF